MSESPPLLVAERLGRDYREVAALTDVDLTLGQGESVGLLGPNGAGKTTLLAILAGVERATSGQMSWGETKVGWVPHRPSLYSRLTTRENLRLFARLEGSDDPDATSDELIERADLGEYADRTAAQLSTGTLQRLNLSIALAGRPAALLLDEPTATLSPDQRIRLWEWLADLREELDLALLFSTQSVDEARRRADRLLVLGDGRVVFSGTPGDLAPGAASDSAVAEDAFLSLIENGEA